MREWIEGGKEAPAADCAPPEVQRGAADAAPAAPTERGGSGAPNREKCRDLLLSCFTY